MRNDLKSKLTTAGLSSIALATIVGLTCFWYRDVITDISFKDVNGDGRVDVIHEKGVLGRYFKYQEVRLRKENGTFGEPIQYSF